PIRRDILAVTDPADPSDRQLGETLRRLKLIDAPTLQALLVETRRQRRPLRQLLLTGGALTLYQLSLIEADNVDGLVLGPVRVVDRLRANAQEIVYHVVDPRRGHDAVLRHLAQDQLRIPGRAEEFKKSFSQIVAACGQDQETSLVRTFEVLEIADRPAAL